MVDLFSDRRGAAQLEYILGGCVVAVACVVAAAGLQRSYGRAVADEGEDLVAIAAGVSTGRAAYMALPEAGGESDGIVSAIESDPAGAQLAEPDDLYVVDSQGRVALMDRGSFDAIGAELGLSEASAAQRIAAQHRATSIPDSGGPTLSEALAERARNAGPSQARVVRTGGTSLQAAVVDPAAVFEATAAVITDCAGEPARCARTQLSQTGGLPADKPESHGKGGLLRERVGLRPEVLVLEGRSARGPGLRLGQRRDIYSNDPDGSREEFEGGAETNGLRRAPVRFTLPNVIEPEPEPDPEPRRYVRPRRPKDFWGRLAWEAHGFVNSSPLLGDFLGAGAGVAMTGVDALEGLGATINHLNPSCLYLCLKEESAAALAGTIERYWDSPGEILDDASATAAGIADTIDEHGQTTAAACRARALFDCQFHRFRALSTVAGGGIGAVKGANALRRGVGRLQKGSRLGPVGALGNELEALAKLEAQLGKRGSGRTPA